MSEQTNFGHLPREIKLICFKDLPTSTLKVLSILNREIRDLIADDDTKLYRRRAYLNIAVYSPALIAIHFRVLNKEHCDTQMVTALYLEFSGGYCQDMAFYPDHRRSVKVYPHRFPRDVVVGQSIEHCFNLITRGCQRFEVQLHGTLSEESMDSIRFILNKATTLACEAEVNENTEIVEDFLFSRRVPFTSNKCLLNLDRLIREAGHGTLTFEVPVWKSFTDEMLMALMRRADLTMIITRGIDGITTAGFRNAVQETLLNNTSTSDRSYRFEFKIMQPKFFNEAILTATGPLVTPHFRNRPGNTYFEYITDKNRAKIHIFHSGSMHIIVEHGHFDGSTVSYD